MSVRLMLPILSGGNRSKYAKVLRWLLEEYERIPDAVREQFMEGGFVVRTSSQNLYGCQHADYTIETQLMEPFKGAESVALVLF